MPPSPVPTYLHPAVPAVDVAEANLQVAAGLVDQVLHLLDEEVVVLHAGGAGGGREGMESCWRTGGWPWHSEHLPPSSVTPWGQCQFGRGGLIPRPLPADEDVHRCQRVGGHDPRCHPEHHRVGENGRVGDALGEASRNQGPPTPHLPLSPQIPYPDIIFGVS